MKVKILSRTFRENPNYMKQSRVKQYLGSKMTFYCDGELPEVLQMDNEDWDWSEMVGDMVTEGVIHTPELFEKLIEWISLHPGCGVRVKSEAGISYLPYEAEQKYLYSYSNPEIECGACGNKEKLNSISTIEDDDTGEEITKCGKCGRKNTFEDVEYETVEEFLKRRKI